MIPNRKVVGSNPAKDTTRILYYYYRNLKKFYFISHLI